MAFVINDSYNIISRRMSNVGISFTQTHTQTDRQFNLFPSLNNSPAHAHLPRHHSTICCSLPSVASSHKFLSLAPFSPCSLWYLTLVCKTKTRRLSSPLASRKFSKNIRILACPNAWCSELIRDNGVKWYEFILFKMYEFTHVGIYSYCLNRMNSNMHVWIHTSMFEFILFKMDSSAGYFKEGWDGLYTHIHILTYLYVTIVNYYHHIHLCEFIPTCSNLCQ